MAIIDTIMKLVIDSPNYTDWYQKSYNSRIESKKKELEELENKVQYLKEKLEILQYIIKNKKMTKMGNNLEYILK